MSSNALRSQGMTVHVATGSGGAKNITAITKAFKAEITSTAHGLSKGDRVTIASVGGMTEMDGLVLTVLDVGTNVFVVDVDSRTFTTYTSGGTATPAAYTKVSEVKAINPSGAKLSDIDVTDLDSTAKEFFPGLVDNGDFSLDVNYLPSDAGQDALRTSFEAGDYTPLKVTSPSGTIYTFNAYVKDFPTLPKASVDGVQVGTIAFKISGAVTKS